MSEREPILRLHETDRVEERAIGEGFGPLRRATVHAPARVTLDPPSSSLPESVVSVGELGLSYQVLEDWNDD